VAQGGTRTAEKTIVVRKSPCFSKQKKGGTTPETEHTAPSRAGRLKESERSTPTNTYDKALRRTSARRLCDFLDIKTEKKKEIERHGCLVQKKGETRSTLRMGRKKSRKKERPIYCHVWSRLDAGHKGESGLAIQGRGSDYEL